MILAIYTKDSDKILEILTYIDEKYSIIGEETSDINWGGGSSMEKYCTFLSIPDEIIIDIAQIQADCLVTARALEGNNFYKVETYVPTINDYIPILERLLETKAKEYFFDNSVDACSYTGSDNAQFRRESLAFVAWRDQLWGPVFEQLKVDLTSGPVDFDQFLSNLPSYESYLDNQTI